MCFRPPRDLDSKACVTIGEKVISFFISFFLKLFLSSVINLSIYLFLWDLTAVCRWLRYARLNITAESNTSDCEEAGTLFIALQAVKIFILNSSNKRSFPLAEAPDRSLLQLVPQVKENDVKTSAGQLCAHTFTSSVSFSCRISRWRPMTWSRSASSAAERTAWWTRWDTSPAIWSWLWRWVKWWWFSGGSRAGFKKTDVPIQMSLDAAHPPSFRLFNASSCYKARTRQEICLRLLSLRLQA